MSSERAPGPAPSPPTPGAVMLRRSLNACGAPSEAAQSDALPEVRHLHTATRVHACLCGHVSTGCGLVALAIRPIRRSLRALLGDRRAGAHAGPNGDRARTTVGRASIPVAWLHRHLPASVLGRGPASCTPER